VWIGYEVRYAATIALHYDPADWQLEDSAGDRHDANVISPEPVLVEGDLAAGEDIMAWVCFAVPADVDVASVVLQTPDGQDLVIFTAP
ncbi:MAG: hypothetical protein ABIZ34_04065, partial [Candidatus Limnocylindrales bacterium]